jgi:DNA-directed RNA polymerase specialized sigma24 family protein
MNDRTRAGGGPAAVPALSPDVIQALTILNARQARATRISVHERFDRCKDELLRHPGRSGEPHRLANQAWGNAGQVLRSRAARTGPLPTAWDEVPGTAQNVDSVVAGRELEGRVADFIRREPLPERYRTVLGALLAGAEAEEIAVLTGEPLQRTRVHISRARAKARAAFGGLD